MIITCHLMVSLVFLFIFLKNFIFKKMFTCQSTSVPHVIINLLYSIWSLYSLVLFNLIPISFKWSNFVPFQIETKFNFNINFIMMFLMKLTLL